MTRSLVEGCGFTCEQGHKSVSAAILCTGGLDVIRKEAWPFYKTSTGVRLCWELEEAKEPPRTPPQRRRTQGRPCLNLYTACRVHTTFFLDHAQAQPRWGCIHSGRGGTGVPRLSLMCPGLCPLMESGGKNYAKLPVAWAYS
jgi:hypothetical protein